MCVVLGLACVHDDDDDLSHNRISIICIFLCESSVHVIKMLDPTHTHTYSILYPLITSKYKVSLILW